MFHLNNTKKSKILYRKFLVLKTNINNDIKIFKLKKKKWRTFLTILTRKKKINIKLKPFTNHDYIATKFASKGNSFQSRFKNDLISKKTFNYFYGNLMKKYLKKRMRTIYNSKEFSNYKIVCLKFFESRLDSVLYRSKFCYSIKNAKHLISHKHITVNNQIEKNKDYTLNAGDIIYVNDSAFRIVKHNIKKIIHEYNQTRNKISYIFSTNIRKIALKKIGHLTPQFNLLWPTPPKYLNINYRTLEIIFHDIQHFNFSIYFPFKLNIQSVIINYYRH